VRSLLGSAGCDFYGACSELIYTALSVSAANREVRDSGGSHDHVTPRRTTACELPTCAPQSTTYSTRRLVRSQTFRPTFDRQYELHAHLPQRIEATYRVDCRLNLRQLRDLPHPQGHTPVLVTKVGSCGYIEEPAKGRVHNRQRGRRREDRWSRCVEVDQSQWCTYTDSLGLCEPLRNGLGTIPLIRYPGR
jgi:hypothetical protein